MKFIFSCFANAAYQGQIITELGGRRQLLSYTDNRDKGLLDRFDEYVRVGWLKDFEVKNGKRQKAMKVFANGHDVTKQMPMTARLLAAQRRKP